MDEVWNNNKMMPYNNFDVVRINREFSCKFEFVQVLSPKCNPDGTVQKEYPQSRYINTKQLPLSVHGRGAFCNFRIQGTTASGVYLWVVNKIVVYIGETENLRKRFNTGYGNISPKNCYKNGQSTNCKMNKVVLECFEQGKQVELFYFETANYKEIEKELIRTIRPFYNYKNNH